MMSFALPYHQIKWLSSLLLPLILFLGLPSKVYCERFPTFCEDHCTRYRRRQDSTGAFTFDCRYHPMHTDPDKINYTGPNLEDLGIIHCAKACSRCAELCSEENPYEFHCPDIGGPTTTEADTSDFGRYGVIGIIVICVIVTVCVGGSIFYLIYMGHRKPRVQALRGQAIGGMGYTPYQEGGQVAAQQPNQYQPNDTSSSQQSSLTTFASTSTKTAK